jgi:lysophospholipase L1-like esterase
MPSVSKRAKILLFGDSITQQSFWASNCGWGACIADRYQRRADVLNRGFSGYNSGWFLRFAATDDGKMDLFEHDGVNLVTIFFGANDASDSELNERQHVPLETYKSNIKEIVALTKSNFGEDVKIILISPPPVCHDGRLRFQKERYKEKATGTLERTLDLSGKYAAGAKEVASEVGIPFLNLWTKMQSSEDWRTFLSDGLHLSASGNKFVGESLIEMIDELMPELSVTPCPISGGINSASECSAIKRVAPWHDEIDHKQPHKAFRGSDSD